MADSKEDVASQALARLGEPAISSFEEDTETAEKVNQLYEPTILQLFSSYNWKFAIKRAVLSEDAAAVPVNEWTRSFIMPTLRTERIGQPVAVYESTAVSAPAIFDYERQGRWIMTNRESCVIEYISRVPESQWPGYFHMLAIEALAATLALPVTETATKEEFHRTVAYGTPSEMGKGGLFALATQADSTGQPTESLLDDYDILASARFGGHR